MNDHILTKIEKRVLTITFNRPDKKNALTHAMYAAAAKAMQEAEANDDVRAVLFTGNGDAFTAGNDLIDFQQAGGIGFPLAQADLETAITEAIELVAAARSKQA